MIAAILTISAISTIFTIPAILTIYTIFTIFTIFTISMISMISTISPRFSDKRKPEIMVLNSRSGCFLLFPALFKSNPGKAVVPLSLYKSNPPIYRTKRCVATPSVHRTDFLCAEQRARSVLVRQTPFCPTARSRFYREGVLLRSR